MLRRRAFIIGIGVLIGLSSGHAVVGFLRSNHSYQRPTSGADEVTGLQTRWTPDSLRIESWRFVEDFDNRVAVFETVFWDRSDTESLRELIRDGSLVRGKTVLEVGTGSGLLALCCLQTGAKNVVATDVNRNAVANAAYNAELLGLGERLDVREVPLENASAFSVVEPDEKFDLIISNPPWVNQKPATIAEHALYDANFALLTSLLQGLRNHLKPGGRALLAYGCVDAIKTLQRLSQAYQYELIIRDERNLDDLSEEFLPGMLLEIQLPSTAGKTRRAAV